MKRLLRPMLAFSLILALCVPVRGQESKRLSGDARWSYSGYMDLFKQYPHPHETIMADYEITDTQRYNELWGFPTTREEKVNLSYFTRMASADMTTKGKNLLVDYIRVEIPRGVTLTVGKGSTLTVRGELIVYGTLVNKGTIVVGSTASTVDGDVGLPVSGIRNHGTFTNQGTVEVVHGAVVCSSGGLLRNQKTIAITNRDKDLVGLCSTAVPDDEGGQIVNDGAIRVENVGGVGILVEGEGTLENQGVISKTPRATIQGTISGNKPVEKS